MPRFRESLRERMESACLAPLGKTWYRPEGGVCMNKSGPYIPGVGELCGVHLRQYERRQAAIKAKGASDGPA